MLVNLTHYDTGLAQPSQWDLTQDKQAMQEEQPLQVARCTKIINPNTVGALYTSGAVDHTAVIERYVF